MVYLLPGEPEGSVAVGVQPGVATVVAFASRGPFVGAAAIGLHRDALVTPEEVDGIGAERRVDQGLRQAGPSYEREECLLERTAGTR